MTDAANAAEVAIAGAGPTGLMLAAELALRGVRATVLERHLTRPDFVRAFNLGPRSLELLDRRGIVDRFLDDGRRVGSMSFAGLDTPLDLGCLETDHPYVLGIPQTRTEALLEERALQLGVEIRRGHEVADVTQDEAVVTLEVSVDPNAVGAAERYRMRAQYLVGCDGGRSTIRKRAGIAFPGTPASRWALLGDVELDDPASLAFGLHRTAAGSVFVIPRPGYVRIITAELTAPADRDAPVSLEALSAAVRHVLGREVSLVRPRWLTRFGDAARLAEYFRLGRIFLAGDAAHIHPPAGAQGINVGLQDAFNLGWKLAAALRGWAPAGLLDSYHAERHTAAQRVLMKARAQTELGQPDERIAPVRALLQSLAQSDGARRTLTELATGFDTRYDMGEAADADETGTRLGKLAPNVTFLADGAPTSLAARMRAGRALLITRGERGDLARMTTPRADRLEHVRLPADARMGGWLEHIDAALVRPDGHIAWMSSGSSEPLDAAVAKWLG